MHSQPLDPEEWQLAFRTEYFNLCCGSAPTSAIIALAAEAYSKNSARDPREVARETWGQPQ